MRLSNFLVVVAATGLVVSGNAFSTADQTKISKFASSESIKAVQYEGESKRLLRVVGGADKVDDDDDDIDEERFNWSSLAKHFPSTAAKRAADAAKEEKKMAQLAPAFAGYMSKQWEPINAYKLMSKSGASHMKAMDYAYRYETYLKAHGAY